MGARRAFRSERKAATRISGAAVATVASAVLLVAGCADRADSARAVQTGSQPELREREKAELTGAEMVASIDPQSLVGLDEEQIRNVLGDPDIITEHAPSRVWAYAADACSLDLFFYLDLGTDKFRALTYTVRTFDGRRFDQDVELCLGRIQRENRRAVRRS